MNTLRQKLLEVFAVEYREHLEAIRQILMRTVGSPAAAELAEATRRAHSLKGAARAVALPEVEALAHRLEALFVDAGKGKQALDDDTRRFILDALDEIEDKAAATPPGAEGDGPEATGATPGEVSVAEGADHSATRSRSAGETASIRIDPLNLDRLLRSAGELRADLAAHDTTAADIGRLSRRLRTTEEKYAKLSHEIETELRRQAGGRATAMGAAIDKAAGEMRDLARGLRAAAQSNDRGVRSLSRHLADLERHVKTARMLPAESVFGGFRKMVRDLAASEAREVDVVVEGLECQADRLILQRIKDPVMHMLRNAVSHGIEPPDERMATGKRAAGRITLRVKEDHARLAMVIEDDGRGIDFRKIAEKAAAEGRMPAAEAAVAPPEALLPFLFEAGFSTAAALTTISGRGVGLSVVREAVTALQGTIDVQSSPGRGTRISLSVPVNILSRRLLVVGFRDARFALPTDAVVRVMRIAPADLATVSGRPAVRLDHSALPLASIGEIVGAEDPAVEISGTGASVVIVRAGGANRGAGGALAVAVDSLVGVGEFVVRSMEVAAPHARWSGVVAAADGTPCLVLNPAAFAGAGLSAAATILRKGDPRSDAAKVVLVVDDSITTRTLEKSILEAHGYRVRLSVDGRDALAEVRRDPPDLVVSDIEMPHIDGFELVRTMKREPALSDIPVILVTSRAGDGDRERGLTLGADAYVVKQKFDQTELLETIRQMV